MATSSAIKPRVERKLKAKPALQVNIYEAKTQLSSLVQRAAKGEEIVIAKAGQPLARIVAMPKAETQRRRVGGQNFLGITYMAPDWDAPMTEEELAEWGL
jgi:prevent-host-death family protein